jgi:hypothetical protein
MKPVEVISNVRVGTPQVSPSLPSHTRGIREGNKPGSADREPGIEPVANNMAKGSARRSTSINPKAHEAIDPRMPNLSPA